MKRGATHKTIAFVIISVLLLVLLAACGSDDKETDSRSTNTPIPTFVQQATSTESPEVATSVPTKEAGNNGSDNGGDGEAELNPTLVARGSTNWARLECASCHGEDGAGGAGEIDGIEAPSLLDLTLTEGDFIDWMRSGGSLGSKHQFSTDRLSENGGKNLYQYLLSLGTDQ